MLSKSLNQLEHSRNDLFPYFESLEYFSDCVSSKNLARNQKPLPIVRQSKVIKYLYKFLKKS